ncbi:MAG: hypothetical protein L0H79_02190 [Intrasporangium sp.]|uniref:hypothetical protein n=1 Tax=Intrasporangium sp. TaxID=1925024 RepID=UPI0026472642|nr:hypothetical protein [Intrasporangium sp.]MDN5794544.1 hypothetical protein [Intrasporangium sp.]
MDHPRRQSRDTTSRLVEELEDRSTVLVVDNCEHVIGGAARLVDEILRAAPAPSRRGKRHRGEHVCRCVPFRRPHLRAARRLRP